MEFWLESPGVLLSNYQDIIPNDSMSLAEKLNAMARLSLFLGIGITLLSNDNNYLYIPIVVMALTIFIYKRKQESMENYFSSLNTPVVVPGKTVPDIATYPTVDNPFMNFDNIHDPKDRAPAAKSVENPVLKKEIEQKFNERLFRDAGDLFNKENGQRQFYTMPSTTAMPDTTAFAKWLYQSDPTCKEDGRYCAPYYDPNESV